MFEATYWVITVVYENSENDLTQRSDVGPEKSINNVQTIQMKKNTSWGHFSTGTLTPDREYY